MQNLKSQRRKPAELGRFIILSSFLNTEAQSQDLSLTHTHIQNPMRTQTAVVIVGGGPSGLALSACLNHFSIPNVILEREDCHSSLWKKRAYDRLKLHLAKEFCALPHMPHDALTPTYIPRAEFVEYLDEYVRRLSLEPRLGRRVEEAKREGGMWVVRATNLATSEEEEYVGRYLVAATGENGKGYVPEVEGLGGFKGRALHSGEYKSGEEYEGERVLVVGCGNSGMEIAYDLCSHGAKTSILIRNSIHVATKAMIRLGMTLLDYKLPVKLVDTIIVLLMKFQYGDLSKYGIIRPTLGPFSIKEMFGRSAIIDVGTIAKIKSGEIQVVAAGISRINGKEVVFEDGKSHNYDAIVFATGYVSTARSWLKDGVEDLLNDEGMPKGKHPNHWKGRNRVYCAGLWRRGIAGVSFDANRIADDIREDYYAYTGRNASS